MTSIRRFLILTLTSALVLIVFSAALHGYRATIDISTTLLDNELTALSRAIASFNGEASNKDHTLLFQIWQDDKLIKSSSEVLKAPLSDFKEGFSEKNVLGTRWRVNTSYVKGESSWYMVAQPLSHRFTLTDALTVASITPFIISVPLLAVILFLGITWGLAPLKQLSQKLAKRTGNDLSTISLDREPSELEPVVSTLNSMFSRLSAAFDREQQFASNAAHELRTPLSVMKINIHNIAEELGDSGKLLEILQRDTDRMIHAVNQFLLLTRTSPETFVEQKEAVNLHYVAQEVISDLYGKIEAKQQEISLEGDEVWLNSVHFMLYTLLQNLITNASNYSQEGAQIVVRIEKLASKVILSVADSGPGIPANERPSVLKRFNRATQAKTTTGSGLGLAIVSQIAALHDAYVVLDDATLGGLVVKVEFKNELLR
ncbi:two-component sensor histidine kinase [Alteromonas sp. MMG017]|uniref:ATP-binding protein n=1 Tax=Alteromonas sp. MMG017 TaxID=2822692 RepID=UPI001B3A40A1|nr:two-component sensor histidine kinase [Alteromonas sp. MMG017]